jgi:hemerythrin-like domain-containing protein
MRQKPIKRSKQLTPLSREHHDGLLFVWKLNEGLKRDIEVDRIGKYISWFWKHHLREHFQQEEQILLPKFPKHDLLALQLFSDHEKIRKLISGTMDQHAVGRLARELNDHIRFEERAFFPYAEEKLTAAELDDISNELDKSPHCSDDWSDEFWHGK